MERGSKSVRGIVFGRAWKLFTVVSNLTWYSYSSRVIADNSMLVAVKVTVDDSPKKRRCWKEGDGDEMLQDESGSRSTTRMSKGHLASS